MSSRVIVGVVGGFLLGVAAVVGCGADSSGDGDDTFGPGSAWADGAGGTNEGARSRLVIYVGSGGRFENGIQYGLEACHVMIDDNTVDYNGCCPEGFTPVGSGASGLACLED